MDGFKEEILSLLTGQIKQQREIIRFYNRCRIRRREEFLKNLFRKLQRNAVNHQKNLNHLMLISLRNVLPKRQPRKIWVKFRSDHWYRSIFESDSFDEMLENFRMDKATFEAIVSKLSVDLSPHPEHVRESLSAEKKCAIAIYKLASCDEYRIVGNKFGVHKSSVKKCLYQFCEAVIKNYLDTEIYLPEEEEAREIIAEFERKTMMPQVIGAIDATHIPVTPTAYGYADFINREEWPSLVLQVLVDSNYLFRDVMCKNRGSTHNADVLRGSTLYKHINDINLPEKIINGENIKAFIVGNASYPLLPWLLTRYKSPKSPEEESLNTYISQVGIVAENALSRLKSRWKILQKKIEINVGFVPNIVLTCCILHNIVEKRQIYFNKQWQNDLANTETFYPQPKGNLQLLENSRTENEYLRDCLKLYMHLNYPLLKSNANDFEKQETK